MCMCSRRHPLDLLAQHSAPPHLLSTMPALQLARSTWRWLLLVLCSHPLSTYTNQAPSSCRSGSRGPCMRPITSSIRCFLVLSSH